jgi:hypothetical protein
MTSRRTLDYIFLHGDWKVKKASVIPHITVPGIDMNPLVSTTYPVFSEIDLNGDDSMLLTQTLTCGQPSLQWPSDHFMVLSDLEI